MKSLMRWTLVTAVVVGLAASASAQGRGGGGFGMGFGGGASAHNMVAISKPLQEELKVTEEQVKKLEEAMKPIAEKRREMFGNFRPGQQPSEEDRKKMADAMKTMADDTKKAVEGVLNADQTKRLTQINYQMMGIAAFVNEDVQKALKITDSQKDKIKSISDELREDTTKVMQAGGVRFRPGQQPSDEDRKKMEETRKKTDSLRQEAQEKLDEVLTAEQKKAWEGMIGTKVDTSKFIQVGGRPMRRDN